MSHIGMIIHSTALDTMEKVIAVYGGSEWQRIEGRFLLGSSDDYEINSTGGEAEHTLTGQEMPAHQHSVNFLETTYGAGNLPNHRQVVQATTSGNGSVKTTATGNSKPHNNMPPYKVVYIWERVS